ncbi:18562_t:CDS:2, partial [Racocetra fulgida]
TKPPSKEAIFGNSDPPARHLKYVICLASSVASSESPSMKKVAEYKNNILNYL